MANTIVCQECIKVLGISKLLSPIYLGLCVYSQTIIQYGQERSEVEIDKKTKRDIHKVKREIHKRTSVSSTRSR